MKNLARHIELLLRDNDCVILPGFGGFIAHVVPAYYISSENLYYPPSRSISFNTAITMNDGLLAQSYMKSYNVDYAQATYLIDMAIERLRDMLDEEGSVTIPHIGIIKQDIHQTIQFIAEPAGISSPLHFGLGTLTISTLAQIQTQASKDVQHKGSIITQTERTIDVHIQKRTLRQFLSTAAVFLLLLMIALPIGDLKPTDIASLQLINIVSEPKENVASCSQTTTQPEEIQTEVSIEKEDSVVTFVDNQDTTRTLLVEVTEIPEPTPNSTETIIERIESAEITDAPVMANVEIPTATTVTEAETTTEPEQVLPVNSKTYHIIVASIPNHRGSDEIIKNYLDKGYQEVSLVERDDRVRISLANFTDKEEANDYLKSLREKEEFKNAWLLPVRN